MRRHLLLAVAFALAVSGIGNAQRRRDERDIERISRAIGDSEDRSNLITQRPGAMSETHPDAQLNGPAGRSGGSGTGTNAGPGIGFTYPDPADYSTLSWTAAFKAAHDKFSREYAFSDWKGVDWPGLYSRFLPRIVQAQAVGDEKAYYLALHEYVCSIPDRHISLAAENAAVPTALGKELAGGGFGMAVAELDDWRVIAAAIVPNSQADRAGIVAGAEIFTWGGVPARTAIGQIDVGAVPFVTLGGMVGSEKPQATLEHYRLEQARLLTRGPVGTEVQVVFKNPDSTTIRAVTLTAVDDAGQTFSLLDFARQADFSDAVDYRILPEGYAYIRVRMEHDIANPQGYPMRIYQQFQQAIISFVAANVPGVIVDLRGNFGGSDDLSADLCGFFYAAPSFYEYQEYYDKRTGQFLRITVSDREPVGTIVDHISIEPQTPRYSGPVVALVNPATHSSGEGPAMGIARLPQGSVIGFHGTGGSFGMVGGTIVMPGGYTIEYPYGRTLDQYGVIQVDSRNRIGGVAPNPRVPKTLENVLAFAVGTDVELQYAVKYLRER
jgi:carboxyl-terminal processing protease